MTLIPKFLNIPSNGPITLETVLGIWATGSFSNRNPAEPMGFTVCRPLVLKGTCGSGFQGSGFRVWGLGLLGFRVEGLGFHGLGGLG